MATTDSYSEHLDVPIGWGLLALGFAATLVVAVGAYTNITFAIGTAVLSLLLVALWFLGWGRVPVATTRRGLVAGHAKVDWDWVQAVEPLDAAAMRAATGPEALATAYLVTRPYVKTGVRVVLDDPADPHPYWLVSTRHPERLVAAAQQHLASNAASTNGAWA